MREFFHGWRRKVGCVTLVLATIMAGVWSRSESYHEGIVLPSGNGLSNSFYSFRGNLNWMRAYDRTTQKGPLTWVSIPRSEEAKLIISLPHLKWQWQFCGFGIREFSSGTVSIEILVIPYWYVIPPLTVLSAYLILWKPRKTSAKTSGVVDGV